MARLLVTLGTRDAGGTAAVDARGSVTVAARTRRGAAGAATASSWAAGRRWALLLALGWLVQVGLRVWFSRQQVMPLANPDETAYLVTARVLAGGPAADLSEVRLRPSRKPSPLPRMRHPCEVAAVTATFVVSESRERPTPPAQAPVGA